MGELIGYARCSTVLQDLTAQRQALAALGVPDDRVYLGKSLTDTSRAPAWTRCFLAAVRSGDTLVVPKLDPARPLFPRGATVVLVVGWVGAFDFFVGVIGEQG